MIAAAGILTALLTFAPVLEPPSASRGQLEHAWQLNHGAAIDHYWDAVAQCETGQNWNGNKGQWSGGLGIYQRTWEGFGGLNYARHPWQATRIEQIVIANRIDKFGHQTRATFLTWDDKIANRPMFRFAAGHWGWGCIKNTVGNQCGVRKDGSRGTYSPPRRIRLLRCRK